jgi:peptide/nickel transport system permease protein
VISYIAKRLAMALVVVYVVISLSFYMIRLMPGNAMEYLQAQLQQEGGLTPQEIQSKIQAIFGVLPKGPLWKQYLQYVGNIFQGNFGNSILDPGESVLHIIAGALPWTIFAVAVALLISFCLGLAVGTLMAAFPESMFSKLTTGVVSFLSSVPNYVVALVLIYFLVDQKHLFPFGGAYSINTTVGWNIAFIGSAIYHAVLPVSAYVIVAFGGWALTMKGSVASVLGGDYVRAAESWGLGRRRVTQSYVGRNAMLPMVTNLALALGYMFGGSVFIETYFSYPGIGYYLIQAVDSRDYPVMMGCFILITVAVVLANLLADLMYPLVDPRITSPARTAKAARAARAAMGAQPAGTAGGALP